MVVENVTDTVPAHMMSAPGQTEEQKNMLGLVYNRHQAAKKECQPYHKEWDRAWNFYTGKHWPEGMPKWKAKLVINRIFSTIESFVPRMTDGDPRFSVIGDIPETREIGTMLEKLIDHKWSGDWRMKEKLQDFSRHMLINGSALWKVYWDPAKNNGFGEVGIDVVDPYNFFPDPAATCMEDMQWCINAVPISEMEAIRRYPQLKDKIKADPTLGSYLHSVGGQTNHNPYDHEGRAAPASITGDVGSVRDKKQGRVYLMEMWTKDDTTEKVPVLTTQEQQALSEKTGVPWEQALLDQGIQPYEEFPLYPNGRVVVTVGNQIVDDKPNPFMHGQFPYVKVDDHSRPGKFWGMGTVYHLISPQKELNKRKSQVIDHLNFSMGAPLVVDSNSGVKQNQFKNKPNAVVEKAPGTEIFRLPVQPVQAAIFRSIDDTQDDIDSISGNHDVTQGRRPKGVTAASAIAELQEEALSRVRRQVDMNEDGLSKMGRLVISNIKQFYQVPMVFPIVGMQNTIHWLTYDPKLTDGVQWQVRVESGSTMPVSRVARAAEAFQYFTSGLIDREAALIAIDFPNFRETLFRMEQKEILLAQIAAQGDTVQE